jgi:hypothetical protein
MKPISQALRSQGHVFVPAADMRAALEAQGDLSDWPQFAESWNHLSPDLFMADQGRYRRRRHAVYAAKPHGGIELQAHQPHYQSRDYNALNGGVERWFEPVESGITANKSLATVLDFCRKLFDDLAASPNWHIEIHQFRIEATQNMQGLPTPEGMHRDGVDYVLVLLVRRQNIASGTTMIHGPDGLSLGSFTLTTPFDATLIDDTRVAHGVTAVTPLDPTQPAYRDVLVVTFRRA